MKNIVIYVKFLNTLMPLVNDRFKNVLKKYGIK